MTLAHLRAPPKITNKQVSLIRSTGRTGTRFLGLNVHKLIANSCSSHEPDVIMRITLEDARRILKYGLYNTVIGRVLGKTGLRNIASRCARGELTIDQAAWMIRAQRRRIYNACPKPLYTGLI